MPLLFWGAENGARTVDSAEKEAGKKCFSTPIDLCHYFSSFFASKSMVVI
jgi:hypothetical protein